MTCEHFSGYLPPSRPTFCQGAMFTGLRWVGLHLFLYRTYRELIPVRSRHIHAFRMCSIKRLLIRASFDTLYTRSGEGSSTSFIVRAVTTI